MNGHEINPNPKASAEAHALHEERRRDIEEREFAEKYPEIGGPERMATLNDTQLHQEVQLIEMYREKGLVWTNPEGVPPYVPEAEAGVEVEPPTTLPFNGVPTPVTMPVTEPTGQGFDPDETVGWLRRILASAGISLMDSRVQVNDDKWAAVLQIAPTCMLKQGE